MQADVIARPDSLAGDGAANLSVDNSTFLRLLLANATGYGWVLSFSGDPGNVREANWFGRPWAPSEMSDKDVDSYGDRNSYYSVAELKGDSGKRQRVKANFKRLRALVVDDFTGCTTEGSPTYVLQTSPGKVQVGVFIDPDDPDAADPALVSAVMHQLYERKLLGDSSGNNLVRYVRLPVGVNQKPREEGPWQHVMLHWQPGQVLSLDDACGVFGIDLDSLRGQAATAPDMVLLGEGQDRLMAEAMQRIVTGEEYHESLNRVAASLVASGAAPGAAVNLLRGLMSAAQAPRDDRWGQRYADIPRAVETAAGKFQAEAYVPPPLVATEGREKKLLWRADELLVDLRPTDWLVQGLLVTGAMSMMYGPPGLGKSFLAFELACCIATGTPFFGRPVKKGPVVLVAGEGHDGIRTRLAAWCKERNVSLGGAGLYVTDAAVPMLDRAKAVELLKAIDARLAVEREEPVRPVAFFIDTLARNFGDGDENSSKDAGVFVATLDELLRARYGAHVMLVHHTGHDGGRARGSSSFKGAMDQEFALSAWQGAIKLSNQKMKDGPKPEPIMFTIEPVEVGETDDGEVIRSAVLKRATSELDDVIYEPAGRPPITAREVLKLAGRDGIMPGETSIAQSLSVRGAKNTSTIVKRLRDKGLLEPVNAHSNAQKRLTDAAVKALSMAGDLITTEDDGVGDEPVAGG